MTGWILRVRSTIKLPVYYWRPSDRV